MQIVTAAAVEIIVFIERVAGIRRKAETVSIKRAAARIAFALLCNKFVMVRDMRLV